MSLLTAQPSWPCSALGEGERGGQREEKKEEELQMTVKAHWAMSAPVSLDQEFNWERILRLAKHMCQSSYCFTYIKVTGVGWRKARSEIMVHTAHRFWKPVWTTTSPLSRYVDCASRHLRRGYQSETIFKFLWNNQGWAGWPCKFPSWSDILQSDGKRLGELETILQGHFLKCFSTFFPFLSLNPQTEYVITLSSLLQMRTMLPFWGSCSPPT